MTNIVSVDSPHLQDGIVLRADGTVATWGPLGRDIPVPRTATNITAVAAGLGCFMALRGDGTVITWGNREIPGPLTNVAAIAGSSNLGEGGVVFSDGRISLGVSRTLHLK